MALQMKLFSGVGVELIVVTALTSEVELIVVTALASAVELIALTSGIAGALCFCSWLKGLQLCVDLTQFGVQ